MDEIALIDATCKAYGHPPECTEPAIGAVTQQVSNGITVTSSGGTTKEVATENDTLDFPSHAHDHSEEDGCHDMQSHSITADGEPSIMINGTPVYQVEDTVATDPGSGGTVNISSNPFQSERVQ